MRMMRLGKSAPCKLQPAWNTTLSHKASSRVCHITHTITACLIIGMAGWVGGWTRARCASPVSQTPACWSRCLSFPQRSSLRPQIFKSPPGKRGLTPSKRYVPTGWTDRLMFPKDKEEKVRDLELETCRRWSRQSLGAEEQSASVPSPLPPAQAGRDWGQQD